MTDVSQAPQAEVGETVAATQAPSQRGLPVWMPLAALVFAIGLAIFAGIRIAPTVLGLVLPPSPPLPLDQMTLIEEKRLSAASYEWSYSTPLSGCEVARYVDERMSREGQTETPCFYEVTSGCSTTLNSPGPEGAVNYRVAQCYGVQGSGQSRVRWSLIITSGYSTPAAQTRVRVFRDATNMQE
jgi:hypothetical protein